MMTLPLHKNKLLIGAFFVLIGIFIGRYIVPAGQPPLPLFTVENGQRELTFPTFWETWDKLHGNFIGTLDDKKLLYGAVAGMVAAAGDPYTTFQDPETTKQFEETLSGSFSGIGVEIGMHNGFVTVIAPLKGSPAEKAGLKPEDIIVAVDGTSLTTDTSIDQVVRLIRGPRGQSVVLTIVRKDAKSSEDITVVREVIKVESVRLEMIGSIAHITIVNFNGDTAERFKEAAQAAIARRASGIILDMRNNPGGFLQAAVDITSQFLEPGSLVVSEKGTENDEYYTSGRPLLKDMPVVVLINKGSASASEIVAGALLDTKQAPIIGIKSFGKGSVQQLLELKDRSSLKVTIAKWYTPAGHSIDEQGIEPTIVLEDTEDDDKDLQLDRAVEEITKLINS